jgi:tetratricopeptide (TPR) repeat protein
MVGRFFEGKSRMIVSTTLCKNNESIIQDALRSIVTHVDKCILIDTGCTDATVEKAREVAGDKLVVVHWVWQKDFASARNFALAAATQEKADWMITVDSDERIVLDPNVALHELLANAQGDILSAYQVDGTYEKPRVIKLPTACSWVGATHEYLNRGNAKLATLKELKFAELGKSLEGALEKFHRDIEILTGEIAKDPKNTRWHFYLGDSYKNCGKLEEAAQAYEACAALKGWDEEAAWACYRAAEIRGKQGDRVRAIELCAQGLGLHPGIAELAWLAGFHCFYLGRMYHAVHWCRLAISMGMYAGHFQDTVRIGFRDMPALWERPYDVLRFALRALGKPEAADEAEGHWKRAETLRKERFGSR